MLLRLTSLVLLPALLAGAGSWLDVPFLEQTEDGCGAAAIAMVMQYWEHQKQAAPSEDSNADRIYAQLSDGSGKGITGAVLQDYLNAHGFRAFVIDGERRDLEEHLAKGRPVVVCLAPRGPRAPLHYVVVVGLTASGVLFHDPARGKLFEETRDAFEQQWRTTRNWTLLAVPRS